MIKYLKSYFSLKYMEYAFKDVVVGRNVNKYKDCFGHVYLKHSRWGLFRVCISKEEKEDDAFKEVCEKIEMDQTQAEMNPSPRQIQSFHQKPM